MNSSGENDLSCFLQEGVHDDLKIAALREVSGLTATAEGCSTLLNLNLVNSLLKLLSHKNEIISQTAFLSVVNLSASRQGSEFILNSLLDNEGILKLLFNNIIRPSSTIPDACCMILSNITRTSADATRIYNAMQEAHVLLSELIDVFVVENYNLNGCSLNHLASLFLNLSQNSDFRKCLLQEENCPLKKLLPFSQISESVVKRQGVVGTIKNCSFETEFHKWLLGPVLDVLPYLLLPLAGPEEFDEVDNQKLPVDLQYLNNNKKRESNPEIRKMLLETLFQLCATEFGREFLRKKNAYVILREYHKWETIEDNLLLCEDVVNMLIRTEEEIGEANLKEIHVPNELVRKFERGDEKQFVKNLLRRSHGFITENSMSEKIFLRVERLRLLKNDLCEKTIYLPLISLSAH